ncbi:unnamed protein product [Paramecium sonneborni]|uniref:Uncharacterized protein n=1 Tax=Paramecium sonneborni TaxID=65129 RepID=A0A8S1M4U6_9CILI|nr:unnamed protein product [Paramecium sonneborni]
MSDQFDDGDFVDGEEIQDNKQNNSEQINNDQQNHSQKFQEMDDDEEQIIITDENLNNSYEKQQKMLNNQPLIQSCEQIQEVELQSSKSMENQNLQNIEQQEGNNLQVQIQNDEIQQPIQTNNNETEQQNNFIDENDQIIKIEDDDFQDGEEIQIENVEENVNDHDQMKQSQEKQQEQFLNNNNDRESEEEEEIIELDKEDNENKEDKENEEDGQQIDEDDFISGEEIEVYKENQELIQNQDDNDEEFEEGELIEEQENNNLIKNTQENDQTNINMRMPIVNKNQIDQLYSELCYGFQCPLQKNFEFDQVPAQQFSSIESCLDKNSVNYLLERESQHYQGQKDINNMPTPSKININETGVSQELKNAFLDQIKLYTLVWTKYQPYIEMSDQYKFVIEYPTFEYVDVTLDRSPIPRGGGISQFQLADLGKPGLQDILDLIPDYSKLLEQTFSNET